MRNRIRLGLNGYVISPFGDDAPPAGAESADYGWGGNSVTSDTPGASVPTATAVSDSGGTFSTIVGGAGSILGKLLGNATPNPFIGIGQGGPLKPASDNTLLYVGGAAALLLVVFAVSRR